MNKIILGVLLMVVMYAEMSVQESKNSSAEDMPKDVAENVSGEVDDAGKAVDPEKLKELVPSPEDIPHSPKHVHRVVDKLRKRFHIHSPDEFLQFLPF